MQDLCRDRATYIMDEFYGPYSYTGNSQGTTVNAVENITGVYNRQVNAGSLCTNLAVLLSNWRDDPRIRYPSIILERSLRNDSD